MDQISVEEEDKYGYLVEERVGFFYVGILNRERLFDDMNKSMSLCRRRRSSSTIMVVAFLPGTRSSRLGVKALGSPQQACMRMHFSAQKGVSDPPPSRGASTNRTHHRFVTLPLYGPGEIKANKVFRVGPPKKLKGIDM